MNRKELTDKELTDNLYLTEEQATAVLGHAAGVLFLAARHDEIPGDCREVCRGYL